MIQEKHLKQFLALREHATFIKYSHTLLSPSSFTSSLHLTNTYGLPIWNQGATEEDTRNVSA